MGKNSKKAEAKKQALETEKPELQGGALAGDVQDDFDDQDFGNFEQADEPIASVGTPNLDATDKPSKTLSPSAESIQYESETSKISAISSVSSPNINPKHGPTAEQQKLLEDWKQRIADIIAKRDEEAKVKRETELKSAKEQIENFYKEYNEKKDKANSEAKEKSEAAAEALKTRDNLKDSKDGFWEKVAKQIEDTQTSLRLQEQLLKGSTSSGADISETTNRDDFMYEMIKSLAADPNSPCSIDA
ncbi:hypothetical protein AX774_g2027 [Zancudomyces culisetae]|uniref:Clathrin light chain n=1 Tax=Zancudomyces culisetae TaxID=1213189 RepID=A0A1R1PTX5_ZANCU|nr:hypothetical protein AX774_g2027 [Zancudomyces culisetae]|eukprot:OMH84446.1 hypothetical protein AX774_g2027 [Zancudomyces culisetae]